MRHTKLTQSGIPLHGATFRLGDNPVIPLLIDLGARIQETKGMTRLYCI